MPSITNVLRELRACSNEKQERDALLRVALLAKECGILDPLKYRKACNMLSSGSGVDACLLLLPPGSRMILKINDPGPYGSSACIVSPCGDGVEVDNCYFSLPISIAVSILSSGDNKYADGDIIVNR